MLSDQRFWKIITPLFFLGILLVMFINIKSPYNLYDEGFAVLGGERVLKGEMPYRDFWALYPPGQFYMLASSYALLGNNLLSARLYDTLVRFVITLLVYLLLRRAVSRWPALAISMMVGFMLAAVGFYSYAVFPALAIILGAFLAFLRYLDEPRRRWLVISGLLVGAAALFRLDLGAYAVASLTGAAFLFNFLQSWHKQDTLLPGQNRWARGLLTALRESLIFPVVVLLVMLPLYGLVILRAGWGNVVDQLFVFPTTGFHEQRWLPYPTRNPLYAVSLRAWYEFYLPPLVYAMSILYYLARIFWLRRPAQAQTALGLALSVFGALLFAQALSRYDYIHVLPSTILMLVTATVLAFHLAADLPWRVTRLALPLVLLVLALLYLRPTAVPLLTALRNFQPLGCYSTLEKAACILVEHTQHQAAEYINAQAGPGERIYSGNTRHDSIFVNDVGLYYIADRLPGTRYHELHPGVATTLPVQQEIARNLEDQQVRWAMLFDLWQSQEPNASRLSSGVYYLDEYLRANYEIVNQYGMYQIWRRK